MFTFLYRFGSIVFVLLSVFIVPHSAQAARMFLEDGGVEAYAGANYIKINAFVDTEGVLLNTFGARLIFPTSTLIFKDVNNSQSIINAFVEAPHLTDNGVLFSGITPGGFQGNRGFLVSFLFAPNTAATARISLDSLEAYQNDGQGTPVAVTTKPLSLTFTPLATSTTTLERILPELFTPVIFQNTSIPDAPWMVAFTAQDKQSGIAYFEVQENLEPAPKEEAWQRAVSPVVLTDQSLKSYTFVKAVDRHGNSRVVVLAPLAGAWYTTYFSKVIFSCILLGLVIIIVRVCFLRRKQKGISR
jgi:hypothetical protein